MDYEKDDARITDNFRSEWYSLSTGQHNDAFYTLNTAEMASTVANEKQTYFQGANTVHAEKQFTDWLFASGGYLYSGFNGDASVDVTTMNPAALDPSSYAPGWKANDIQLERDSNVFSLSSLLGPWDGLSLSLGLQNEWTHQTGFGNGSFDLVLPFEPLLFPQRFQSSTEQSIYSQEAGVRYTKIPFTTVFAEGRFQEETIGQTEQETGDATFTPFQLQTDAKTRLEDFRGGFNTSPWRRVSLSAQYHQFDHHTDYNNIQNQTFGPPYAGYPGFILWRDLLSQQAEAKLSWQAAPWIKTSLSYQWLENNYHTATESVNDPLTGLAGGISPGGSLLAGNYQAQTVGLNATMTPWRRLFLSSTFSYQNARTVTSANGSASVAPYEGNIYNVMSSASYILDQKTDLTASYSVSIADFAQGNSADGLPLGINYQQHAVQIGIRRQIGKGKSFSLRYSFYHYDEPSSGGFNNFNAQAVFAMFSFQIP